MEIRSNTLFTPNEFHSSFVGISCLAAYKFSGQLPPFEHADTRTWRTLSNITLVARLRLKKGEHLISLPNAPGAAPLKVRIEQNHQVKSLRALGERVYSNGVAFEPAVAPESGVVSGLK